MKILLFGSTGQVGRALATRLSCLGTVVALSRDSKNHCGNLDDLNGIATTTRAINPDVIVNAAAYTAVDKAEREIELAHRINADAPNCLAEEALRCGAWLVHYSTDYVFDGTGTSAWREDAPTGPLNVYGRTKLEGDSRIQKSGCNHIILRTSWVYGRTGNNFARTMLRLAKERQHLTVIDDQIGAPTSADLIAKSTTAIVRALPGNSENSGIYNLAATGETSWLGYARHVLTIASQQGAELKVAPENIEPIATHDYKTDAQRPLNSRLDTSKICHTWGVELPHWQDDITQLVPFLLEAA